MSVPYDKPQFKNSSTYAVVMELINDINTELDNGNYILLRDIQRAFDIVEHQKLVTFLEQVRLESKTNKLIRNYTRHRKKKNNKQRCLTRFNFRTHFKSPVPLDT